MKTKILISAANGVIMSSLIKSLKKKFYVIGIDTQIIGQGKNVCNEFYKSPKGNSNNFIKFIKKLAKKVDFIFLFVDEEILQIQKNRKKLNSIEKKLILSNDKTLDTCLNKRKFHTFCIKNKINTPSFSYCKNMIAKPIYGRGGDNIFNISNKGDYNFFKKKKNFIVQKFIKGKEYTIDCLFDRNGELIFALPRIRMVHKGVSIVGKTVKDKRIETFIKELSRNMIFFWTNKCPINKRFCWKIMDFRN